MLYSEKPATIKQEIANALSERFRNSLSGLGLSRDMHIFDLDLSHLSFFYNKEALRFINLIQDFYSKLDPLDKMVFINDYLECGRHHAYWWMCYFTMVDYTIATREMNDRVKSALGGKLYGN